MSILCILRVLHEDIPWKLLSTHFTATRKKQSIIAAEWFLWETTYADFRPLRAHDRICPKMFVWALLRSPFILLIYIMGSTNTAYDHILTFAAIFMAQRTTKGAKWATTTPFFAA